MALGNETISITIDGQSITLRPSLGGALRLAANHGNLAAIIKQIQDGNINVIIDVIDQCTVGENRAIDFFRFASTTSIAKLLATLQAPLISLVINMAGPIDKTDKPVQSVKEAKSIPFKDHFENLFSIATGQLGWLPAEAWQATPTEILAAHKDRIELLQMIFGSGDTKAKRQQFLSLDDKARLAFASIGTRKAA